MIIIIIIRRRIRWRRRRRRRATTTTTCNNNNNNNNPDKKCTLIDVATPSDKTTYTKVSKNLSKYKDLEIEITRMWQMKREIIPAVVGALEVINKDSEELVREIPENINNNNNNNNNSSSSSSSGSGSSSYLVRNTNKRIVLFTVSCSRSICTRSSSIALWSSSHHPKLIFCLLPQPINSCTFSWCFDFHWVIFVLLHFPEVYGVIRNYAIPGLGRNRLPFQKNAGAVYCFCTIQFRSSWRYCKQITWF